MKETILLFNPPEKEKLLKIAEQYCQPLGVLAGIKDMAPAEGTYEGGELPDTLFVFCFMEGNRLDQALAALRKCGGLLPRFENAVPDPFPTRPS